MPHKRAKRSIREQMKVERKSDLPPSQPTFVQNDIPKSMARVLNAEAVQSAWRAKKRALDGEEDGDGEGSKRKKRKTEGGPTKTEIRIKPGESLRHFKRRVEDDMRPVIRSAMKNTTSVSKQKSKQSQKDAEQLANTPSSKKKGVTDQVDSDSEDVSTRRRKGKYERDSGPEFAQWSSAAPKRLNDIVQAPPELKSVPRLNRLVQKARRERSENKGRIADESEDRSDGVITQQQKRMMELEREKAINRYRALKDAKLKGWQKDSGISV